MVFMLFVCVCFCDVMFLYSGPSMMGALSVRKALNMLLFYSGPWKLRRARGLQVEDQGPRFLSAD